MRSLLLIWHEAGNPLYRDRFDALADYFKLTVYGFKRFQGVSFRELNGAKFGMQLFRPLLAFHWLTVFSIVMLCHLTRKKHDYIYLHEEPHSLLSFLTCIFGRVNKGIYLDCAVINYRLSFNGLNFLEKFVYRRASGFFYRNDDVREVLIRRGCPSAKLIRVLGNGVSENTFKKLDSIDRSDFFGRKVNPFVVGYAGRIWKWKGIEALVDVAALSGVTVVVCGPVWDQWLLEKLEASGVVVMPKLGKDELLMFYSCIDLFILPSLPAPNWKEQFGRVIVEGVFCGVPAIGSDTGFIPNLVGRAACFPAGDVGRILSLVQSYADSYRRAELLKDQRARLMDEYSWEGIAKILNGTLT